MHGILKYPNTKRLVGNFQLAVFLLKLNNKPICIRLHAMLNYIYKSFISIQSKISKKFSKGENMKHSKRTAYLLCFSLIISVLFPASACLAETPSPENPAALLHSLGIMQGPNPKAFQPDLTAPATKVTGVVLLARTLGYSAEAQAMSPKEVSGLLRPFKDGDEVPHWAAGYIADAVKRKLINGNNGFLEPNTQLTNQNYYKMLLNALGYEQGADFTWAEVKSFADSKGLGKDTSKKI